MAGHSKWANIQHRKGRQDAVRSKLFSRLSKEISIAAKLGGPDPDANPRLRLAIANAKGQSMPKDNIQRAIDKASGGESEAYEDIRYEGFGPAGVGVIVEVSTDNRNRRLPRCAPPSRRTAAIWARRGPSPSCSTMSARSATRCPRPTRTR